MWWIIVLAAVLLLMYYRPLKGTCPCNLGGDVPCSEYRSKSSCDGQGCKWTCGKRRKGGNCCSDD